MERKGKNSKKEEEGKQKKLRKGKRKNEKEECKT